MGRKPKKAGEARLGLDCPTRNLTQEYRIPEVSGKEGTVEGKQTGSRSSASPHVCPFSWSLGAVKTVPDLKDVAIFLNVTAVFDLKQVLLSVKLGHVREDTRFKLSKEI